MKHRGFLKITDLYAGSERRPGSTCWWWLGALSGGYPRIWTFDHDLIEKYAMSGPQAVWNISTGTGTAGRTAYMRCVNRGCVSPHHIGIAASRAEIGAHIRRTGKQKGARNSETQRANLSKAWAVAGIVPTPPEVVLAIRAAGAGESNMALGRLHGLCHTTVSRIRLGESHQHVMEAA